LLVREYALIPDTGGAGAARGGLGIARQIEALDDETFCYASSEGGTVPADGVFGGAKGGVSRIVRDYGTPRERCIPANQPRLILTAGESVRVETPGGGGFGPPEHRSPAALAADLRAGKVRRAAARQAYGADLLAAAERALADARHKFAG
jgi:N-methylhydantoinase B